MYIFSTKVARPATLFVPLLAAFLAAFLALPAQAQLKFGLRAAPTIALTRVVDNSKNDIAGASGPDADIVYANNGAGLGFSGGLVLDYFIKPSYAFSSGIFYTVKKANVNAGRMLGTVNWNLQQIQVPATIKLYTNELVPDVKVYFQLGGCLDFVVAQKKKSIKPIAPAVDFDGAPFKAVDVSIILGAGAEYRLAESTTVFGGVSYNRGLLNMITKYGALNENNINSSKLGTLAKANDRYSVRLDMVSLDLGIKF